MYTGTHYSLAASGGRRLLLLYGIGWKCSLGFRGCFAVLSFQQRAARDPNLNRRRMYTVSE